MQENENFADHKILGASGRAERLFSDGSFSGGLISEGRAVIAAAGKLFQRPDPCCSGRKAIPPTNHRSGDFEPDPP